jgi:hypothetical protein
MSRKPAISLGSQGNYPDQNTQFWSTKVPTFGDAQVPFLRHLTGLACLRGRKEKGFIIEREEQKDGRG